MSFYGLRDEHEIRLMYEHLVALKKLFDSAGLPAYFRDNLVALGRNMTFLYDEKFMGAYKAAVDVDAEQDLAKLWRPHNFGLARPNSAVCSR